MERFDIEGNEQLTSLVEAAERGEEAVITRGGKVVATVKACAASLRTRDGEAPRAGIDRDALGRLHAKLPDAAKGGAVALVREMRDAGY